MAYIEPKNDADVQVNKKGQALFRIYYEGAKKPDGSRNPKKLRIKIDPPDYKLSKAKFIEKARKQAEELAKELELKAKKETDRIPDKESLKQLGERWLEYRAGKSRKGKRQPMTLHRYKSLLERIYTRNYFGIEFGDIEVSTIDIDIMEEFWHKFAQEKTANGKAVLSKQTVWHHFRALYSVLEYGVERGLLASNPCRYRQPESPDTKEMDCYNEEQVAQIIELLEQEDLQDKVLVTLALETGARVAEILGLKWSDISFDTRLINIDKSWQYLPELGSYEKAPKNRSSIRKVPFSASLAFMLRQLKGQQETKAEKLKNKWVESGAVFVQWNGAQVHPKNASRWWTSFITKANKQCGIPVKNFHYLRHTCLSLLLHRGANPVEVAALAGHSTTATTLRIYAHAIQKEKFQSANIMESIMNGKKNQEQKEKISG